MVDVYQVSTSLTLQDRLTAGLLKVAAAADKAGTAMTKLQSATQRNAGTAATTMAKLAAALSKVEKSAVGTNRALGALRVNPAVASGITNLQSGLGRAYTIASRLRGVLGGLRVPPGGSGGGPGGGYGGGRGGGSWGNLMGAAYQTTWGLRMLASPFVGPLREAASLQTHMLGIGMATRGSEADMTAMRAVIERSASTTMFSVTDVAEMAKRIATSNSFSAQQVTSLIPVYSQFADVQKILKGTDAMTSVTEGVRLAHIAGKFDPASLAKYLDLLTKASLVVPGSLNEVGNALKYSQGMARVGLGVGDDQMIMLTALLNRMGLAGSRGGTNLIAAMIRTIPGVFGSGLLKGKSPLALRDMGFTDARGQSTIMTDGKFDTTKWIDRLTSFVAREDGPGGRGRQYVMQRLAWAFGMQGNRAATMLANDQVLAQLKAIRKHMDEGMSTPEMQREFNRLSVQQQEQTLRTNWKSFQTELGWPVLQNELTVLKGLNSTLTTLTDLVRAYPEATRYGMLGGMGLASLAGAGVALNFLRWSLAPIAGTALATARGIVGLTGALGRLSGLLGGPLAFLTTLLHSTPTGQDVWTSQNLRNKPGGAGSPSMSIEEFQKRYPGWQPGMTSLPGAAPLPSGTQGFQWHPMNDLSKIWHWIFGGSAQAATMPGGIFDARAAQRPGGAFVGARAGAQSGPIAVNLTGRVSMSGPVMLNGEALGHYIAEGMAHAVGQMLGGGARPDFSGGATMPAPG